MSEFNIIDADAIDFAAYLERTQASARIKPAAAWTDEVIEMFHGNAEQAFPTMVSTKLHFGIQFRPGEVTAWTGYNGHRKSMLTSQLANDLCMQRQRVLIASLEMQPRRTLQRMMRQHSGKERPPAEWCRAYQDTMADRLWLFDHVGRLSPSEVLGMIAYFARELQGQHVVVDSMMMVCPSEEHLDPQKQFVTDLVRMAQEHGVHVHLVTHCRKPASGEEHPPGKYDIRGAAAISDQVANVIVVWANKAKAAKLQKAPGDPVAMAEPDALVTIAKQRNGDCEDSFKLWFDAPSLRFVNERGAPVQPMALFGVKRWEFQ